MVAAAPSEPMNVRRVMRFMNPLHDRRRMLPNRPAQRAPSDLRRYRELCRNLWLYPGRGGRLLCPQHEQKGRNEQAGSLAFPRQRETHLVENDRIDVNPRNLARPRMVCRPAHSRRPEAACDAALLAACDVEAGAHVRAGSRRPVPIGLARRRRAGPGRRIVGIAVGGADAERDEGAGRHGDAADLGRRRADAIAELVGALEAQDFLHRRADQVRLARSAAPSPAATPAARPGRCRSGWWWSRGRR